MNNKFSQQAFSELCLVSKQGVCILDMGQVGEKAKQLGLKSLATICEQDLQNNQITDGQYYPLVAALYGEA